MCTHMYIAYSFQAFALDHSCTLAAHDDSQWRYANALYHARLNSSRLKGFEVVDEITPHTTGRSQRDCLSLHQARRRLQQSSKIRLDGQLEFSGTYEAGTDTVQELQTAGCGIEGLCEKIGEVSTQVGLVATGSPAATAGNVALTEIPPASDTDPLQIQAIYTLDDKPTSAQMVLVPNPEDALACARTVGTTSTLFTCYPLRAVPAVVLTVTAPNPQNVMAPYTASLTVYNTSKSFTGPNFGVCSAPGTSGRGESLRRSGTISVQLAASAPRDQIWALAHIIQLFSSISTAQLFISAHNSQTNTCSTPAPH